MEEKGIKCQFCQGEVAYDRDGKVVCWFIGQPDKEKQCPYRDQPVSSAPLKEGTIALSEAPFEPISKQKTIPYSSPDRPSEEPASYGEAPFEPISQQKTIPYSSPDKPTEELAFYQEATHSLPPLQVREPSPPPNPFLPSTPQPPTPQPPPESVVKPRKRRGGRIFVSVVILILLAGSGVLAYYAFRWHSQILSQNATIATQTASFQSGQALLMATIQAQETAVSNEQATQTAIGLQLSNLQATSISTAKNAELGAFFATQTPSPYPTVSATQKTPIHITFTLVNSGTLSWSKQAGFSFICTSGNHSNPSPQGIPICPNQSTIDFGTNISVPTGSGYTFGFDFSPSTLSLSSASIYATFWRVAYHGIPFGTEVYMQVTTM